MQPYTSLQTQPNCICPKERRGERTAGHAEAMSVEASFFLDVFGTFFIKKKSTRAFGAYEPRQGMSDGQTN